MTTQTLIIVRTVADLRARLDAWRAQGHSIGLVPTMGALHDGHFALIDTVRNECDRVVVTLFVNPKQFGPDEDYDIYPRDEARDAAALKMRRVDLLYAPSDSEMYQKGFATNIDVGPLGENLCGAHRPGFFKGVATVVAKLLLQALPTYAYFGEKDYQQLQIVRRMVADLDIPVEIRGVATVREADGLALSSRNAYLSSAEREIAPVLHQTLAAMAERVRDRAAPLREIEAWGRRQLTDAGFGKIDYVEIRDAETLEPVDEAGDDLRILAAAWLGKARLIDNVAVPKPATNDDA